MGRRRSHRYDLMKSRLEIELGVADAERSAEIERQLAQLETHRDDLDHLIPAAALMHSPTYAWLVNVWHEFLLAGSKEWEMLWGIHIWLRMIEIAAGVEEDE